MAVAAALLVDADTHLRDARFYDSVRTSVVSEGTLFRVEAGIALVLAVSVLLRPRRLVWAGAVVVLATAFVAAMLYTYVDVGRLGPLPNMYEPTWVLPGKLASARAEAVGAVLSVVGLLLSPRLTRRGRAGLVPLPVLTARREARGHLR